MAQPRIFSHAGTAELRELRTLSSCSHAAQIFPTAWHDASEAPGANAPAHPRSTPIAECSRLADTHPKGRYMAGRVQAIEDHFETFLR